MGNEGESKIKTIFLSAEKLPFFTLDDLASMETNKTYLKILLSRYEKSGKAVRLKKGIYVAKNYLTELEKSSRISAYSEFLSGVLYQPSYLSLDYILYKHNIITEMPVNFTAVAKKKTISFSNGFGKFFYHKIKPDLFCGFATVKEGGFTIFRATKAKALFDFLYFKKHGILDKKAADELRLNLGELNQKDRKELDDYIKKEGSKKMREIYRYLFS